MTTISARNDMNKKIEKISYKEKLKTLFYISLKLGAFTFGGGYAMFPLIEREYVGRLGYFKEDEMLDIIAVAQSLPGMLAINSSIIIGYRLCGVIGSLIAALGMVLPSLVVMSILSYFYVQFSSNKYVISALKGIRIAVIALLIQAVIKMGKQGVKSLFGWIMAVAVFLLAVFFRNSLNIYYYCKCYSRGSIYAYKEYKPTAGGKVA